MELRTEERRGEEARQLLANPIYVEAYAAIEARIVDQLALAETAGERRERLNSLLVAHRKVRQYMEQVVTSGKMAAMEIDRQASLAERAARMWRAA